jgi:hypothetical protein
MMKKSYEALFLQFSSKVERWLLRFAAVILIILLLTQLLLQFPAVRQKISLAERAEGIPYVQQLP